MTCFDILNIEYNEEGHLLDFDLPDTMRICVKEGDNWSHTEEAIRKQINNMEELYANDVKVVDFTAFYEGTDKPLRGNYEDYEADTFEASGCVGCKMQKPVSKKERVAIQKQVDKFNEQLALDPEDDFERYILLDMDDETLIEDAFFSRQTWKPLTEAFRKRWGKRSELMDKISMAQIGEKSNWSIYSFEKPFWFEYECDPQDTATAEDPEGYGLGFEFDMTKEEAIKKARQIHKETKGAITMFNNARKKSGGGSTRIHPKFWATPEMMEEQKEYYKRENMEWPTGHWIDDGKFNAENDLGFKEWADQEMKTHGKKESFDDWLDDELKSHGDDITLQDWGHHELDSHYERYGSEELDYEDRLKLLYEDFLADWEKENPDSDNPPSFDEWTDLVMEQNPAMFDAEGFRTVGGRGFQIEFKNGYTISIMFGDGNYGDHYNNPDFDYEDSKEYLESSQAEVAIRKPNGQIMLDVFGWVSPDFVAALIPVVATGDEAEIIEVIQNREHREAEDLNWGGDPKGQLATALRNARIKAKQPKKPLKIEKLDAEDIDCEVLNPRQKTTSENWEMCYDEDCGYCASMAKKKNWQGWNAETSGQWEIGEQLEEAQMNAETFEGIPKSVSDLEAVEDVRCDKYELEVNFENEDMVVVSGEELKAIMDDGWDLDSVRSFEDAGMSLLFTRNPNRAFRAEDQNKDLLKWIEDYLWDNDKKGYQAYHAHRKSLGLNAEDKKRRKVSGVLSDPFDELSLDSGGIKRGIIGLGIVGLTILGIKKLRK